MSPTRVLVLRSPAIGWPARRQFVRAAAGGSSRPASAAPGRLAAVRDSRRAVPVHRVRPVRCDRSFAAGLHGSRLTARGRAAVAAAWLVLLALATVPVVRAEIPATPPSADTTIEVLPGDTLWGIARSLDPDADPRDVVDEITRLNGLGAGAHIRPGDVLVVPDGPATR